MPLVLKFIHPLYGIMSVLRKSKFRPMFLVLYQLILALLVFYQLYNNYRIAEISLNSSSFILTYIYNIDTWMHSSRRLKDSVRLSKV